MSIVVMQAFCLFTGRPQGKKLGTVGVGIRFDRVNPG